MIHMKRFLPVFAIDVLLCLMFVYGSAFGREYYMSSETVCWSFKYDAVLDRASTANDGNFS